MCIIQLMRRIGRQGLLRPLSPTAATSTMNPRERLAPARGVGLHPRVALTVAPDEWPSGSGSEDRSPRPAVTQRLTIAEILARKNCSPPCRLRAGVTEPREGRNKGTQMVGQSFMERKR